MHEGFSPVEIRHYEPSRYIEIADLFHGAIHAIDRSSYTDEQLEAWSPSPPDYERWRVRLAEKQPFMAVHRDAVVGFIELEDDGHIDCLYVHRDCQRRGIAGQLLTYAEQVASQQGLNRLFVEASKVAMPLFERHGFHIVSENRVKLNGQTLVNYRMEKTRANTLA